MKKPILFLILLASTSVFASQTNCVLEITDHVKVRGSEMEILDLKADGTSRVVSTELFGETWIISAVKVRNDNNILVTASKEGSAATKEVTQIDGRQQSISLSITADGMYSGGATVKSTMPGTTAHLSCESRN